MNNANLKALLNDDLQTVSTKFVSSPNTPITALDSFSDYTYKVDFECEVGDILLVLVNNKMKTVIVVEKHEKPEIDPDVSYTYQWAVCKIDFTHWNMLQQKEKEFRALLTTIEKRKRRTDIIEQVMAEAKVSDPDLYKELQSHIDVKASSTIEHSIDGKGDITDEEAKALWAEDGDAKANDKDKR